MNNIIFHRWLIKSGKWFKMSKLQQLWNLGSEVGRYMIARKEWNIDRMKEVELRMFELFDMIMWDPRWRRTGMMREICRLREFIVDFFYGDNIYQTTENWLNSYFFTIQVSANEERKRQRGEKKNLESKN